jgi:outer membrane immunogenic protein
VKKFLISAFCSAAMVGGTIASASSPTSASDPTSAPSSASASGPSPAFNGLYIGFGITYSEGNINNKVTYTNGTLRASSKGPGVNGLLGYGALLWGGLYLGAEVGFGYDGSRFNSKSAGSGAAYTWRFHSKSNITSSIAGRLGYAYESILPYLKFGFEGRSDVKLKNSSGNNATFGGKDITLGRNGFILGGGIDYALTNNVFVRAEYTHNYGTSSRYIFNNGLVADFRTPTNTFLIGAGYRY